MPNRFIKSVVSFVIMTALLYGGVSACFADNESAYDSELSGRGFPQIVINAMTLDGKEELCANDQLKFAGASISTMDMEKKSSKGFNITVDRDGKLGGDSLLRYSALVCFPNELIQGSRYIPMLSKAVVSKGMISSGDLTFSIITMSSQSEGHLGYLKVQENYIWRKLPRWRLTDKVEFSWTPGQFEADGRSVVTKDQYTCSVLSKKLHKSDPVIVYRFAESDQTWSLVHADLPGHQTFADQIWGYTSFNLYPSSDMPSGRAKICACYTHIEDANSKVTSCVEAKW